MAIVELSVVLVEGVRAGAACVQVEQSAGLSGGERDQVAPGFILL